MGNGTQENPYTREDVIDKIAHKGGSAWDLDLSESNFKQDIDLCGLDLSGIILNKAVLPNAHFDGSKLKGAKLRDAILNHATFNKHEDKAADLRETDFSGALLNEAQFKDANLTSAEFGATEESPGTYLFDTDFRNANLFFAHFKNCSFNRSKLEGTHLFAADIYDSDLGDADWGSYVIWEENEEQFKTAESIYRKLKMWYTEHGMYGTAAKFYYHEKEANRKSLRLCSKNWNNRLAAEFMRALFGYGERWWNVIYWMAAFLILFGAAYYFWGKLEPLDSLYFSAVSFTALGYGNWVTEPSGWIKILGAFEAFVGVFMMALLLVTFVRKWTR